MDWRLTAESERSGLGRWPADHVSNAAARSSGDMAFCFAESATPSTMERRYSCRVIPLAWAWDNNPASTSGVRFNVTVIIAILIQLALMIHLASGPRFPCAPLAS